MQLNGFVIVGFELEGCGYLVGGGSGVAAAKEGEGEVVVKVFVGGVEGCGALEEGNSVLALTAERDALVVDDF